jgi:hypothetical protein
MGDETSVCPGCSKLTPTIHGRCPNCLYAKNPSAVPARRPYKPPLLDVDDFDLFEFVWNVVTWPARILTHLAWLLVDTLGRAYARIRRRPLPPVHRRA